MKTSNGWRLLARIVPALTVIAPVTLVTVAYLVAVRPRVDAADRARARAAVLHARLVELEAVAHGSPAVQSGVGAERDFERRTPAEDRLPDVVEALARLASGAAQGAVQNLSIETGDQVEVPGPNANAPAGIAGLRTDRPDPRLDLFQTPVTYAPVTVTFDATYAQLGRFFWNLRTLPTTVEVRGVDIVPAAEPPLLRVKLVLFAFRRVNRAIGPGPVLPGGDFSAPGVERRS
jgi:Tfp pilus assembly protein PilO